MGEQEIFFLSEPPARFRGRRGEIRRVDRDTLSHVPVTHVPLARTVVSLLQALGVRSQASLLLARCLRRRAGAENSFKNHRATRRSGLAASSLSRVALPHERTVPASARTVTVPSLFVTIIARALFDTQNPSIPVCVRARHAGVTRRESRARVLRARKRCSLVAQVTTGSRPHFCVDVSLFIA